jgi:co-chaperonin GroES (HSP10)
MKVVNGWILVEKLEEEEKVSKGGIIMAREAVKDAEKVSRWKVLQISENVFEACRKEKSELPYAVGNIIYTHASIGLKIDQFNKDEKKHFLKFDSVIAVESGESIEG